MQQANRRGYRRLTYVAMSVLVAWHTFAMVIAPAPDSPVTEAARDLAQPYLTFFGLQHPWDFFAPTVGTGYRLSYVIEDAAGGKHTFRPGDRLNNLQPTAIWMKDHYNVIMTNSEKYGDAAGAAVCLEHASLNPVSVTLQEIQQDEFWPRDWLNGKRPTDAEFSEVKTLRTVTCPGR